jgi:hypothetical protein
MLFVSSDDNAEDIGSIALNEKIARYENMYQNEREKVVKYKRVYRNACKKLKLLSLKTSHNSEDMHITLLRFLSLYYINSCTVMLLGVYLFHSMGFLGVALRQRIYAYSLIISVRTK